MNDARQAMRRPVRIDGQRIALRDLRVADVTQDYVDWMNDPEVVRYTESRFASHDHASVTAFVHSCAESSESILFGIFFKEGDLHLGNIKLGPVNWHHRLADVGVILGRRSSWGKGIATEAIELVCGYAFAGLSLHKLTAGCYASNVGSARAFLKAGFVQEGLRRKHVMDRSVWEDVIELGLINPLTNSLNSDDEVSKNG